MNWMSSGTERNMSSTAPIGWFTYQGDCARITPKTIPMSVPPSMAQKVMARVSPAPVIMKVRSPSVMEVPSIVWSSP